MALPINRAAGAVTRPLRARPGFVRVRYSGNVLRDASMEPALGLGSDSALAKAAPGRIDRSSFAAAVQSGTPANFLPRPLPAPSIGFCARWSTTFVTVAEPTARCSSRPAGGGGGHPGGRPCFERAPHAHDEAASLMTLPDGHRSAETASLLDTATAR